MHTMQDETMTDSKKRHFLVVCEVQMNSIDLVKAIGSQDSMTMELFAATKRVQEAAISSFVCFCKSGCPICFVRNKKKSNVSVAPKPLTNTEQE